MSHRNDSQITLVLNHLKEHGEITPKIAYVKYGAYRLGAIILVLRDEGYNITTRVITYKKPSGRTGRYALYRLEDDTNGIK